MGTYFDRLFKNNDVALLSGKQGHVYYSRHWEIRLEIIVNKYISNSITFWVTIVFSVIYILGHTHTYSDTLVLTILQAQAAA